MPSLLDRIKQMHERGLPTQSDFVNLASARVQLARGKISKQEYDREVRELGGKMGMR